MTSKNKFTIFPIATFKEEFFNIFHYIKYNLTDPLSAYDFYDTILNAISSLDFMPERYVRILYSNNQSKNLRKFTIGNYIIIYEVIRNTRTNFYFTYFS